MPNTLLLLNDLPVLADVAVRGLVLFGTAATVTLALRRASAATRHMVWTLGIAGALLVPALRPILPRLELPVPSVVSTSMPDPGPASIGDRSSAAPGAVVASPGRATDPADLGLHLAGSPPSAASSVSTTPAASPTSATSAASISPLGALTVLWRLGAILLLLRLAAGWMGLHRLSRRASRLGDPRIRHRATRLALRLGVTRSYRLLEGPAGSMPMTFGLFRATIVLPPDSRAWSRGRLDAVLLHELAHVARRDTATQLLAEVTRALHWLDPLAWLAARRLRVEREHACDDMALSAGPRPWEYADELLDLVRSYRASPAPAAALAMARPGQVASRLRAVLDDGRRRGRVGRAPAAAGSVVALLVALACTAAAPVPAGTAVDRESPRPMAVSGDLGGLQLGYLDHGDLEPDASASLSGPVASTATALPRPLAQEASCIAAGGDWRQVQHQSNNRRITIRMSRRDCDFELRMEGDVDFDAYEMVVRRMGQGARLRLEEEGRGTEHSLDIRVGRDGAPVYEYERDGRNRVFDAEAQAWFSSALQGLFRRTGFMADARVEALLRAGGVEAVLRELGELETSHGFATYVTALLEQARLDEAQLRALVRASGRRVESDHYMAGILEAVATHQPLTGGLLDDYLGATTSLESDHYRSEALEAAIHSGRLTGPQVGRVLEAAGAMDSDHYRSRILTGIADRYALEVDFRSAYLRATADMSSDHYRSEVLGRLLDRGDLSADDRAGVLVATDMVDSDHYRSRLLKKVAEGGLTDPALQRAFFQVAAGLDSDHYHRESLLALLGQGVDPALLVRVLDSAAREIESDHYLSDLLLSVLADYPVEGAVRQAFVAAMDSIGSGHYRGRVADALLRAERP